MKLGFFIEDIAAVFPKSRFLLHFFVGSSPAKGQTLMDEGCLNAAKRRKIEETVLRILQTSDLETATESSIRIAAANQLRLDLSSVPDLRFIRGLVDSFLLSTATAILNTTPSNVNKDHDNINQTIAVENGKKQLPEQFGGGGVESHLKYDGNIICKLADKRMVSIHKVDGRKMVSIRDFSVKDGHMLPKAGISLTPEQWFSFRNSFPAIQEAIAKLESRVSSRVAAEQSEAEMTDSVVDSAVDNKQSEPNIITTVCTHNENIQTEMDTSTTVIASKFGKPAVGDSKENEGSISGLGSPRRIPSETKQIESDVSASAPAFPAQGRCRHTIYSIHPEQFNPIQTSRLDGKNYHSWRHHMQLFLRQSNLAYVLVEPCPGLSINSEVSVDEMAKVKVTAQRWIYDDYMCRQNILQSLCDSLFQCYSPKNGSAKELWEQLKLAYDEDFGTKGSQVSKYVNFQMVDGVSVLEQVHELHKIVNSITASGSSVDENFHVGVIISKLPPSWKELRMRLMHEENLPLNMLMHHLQVEQESRNCNNKQPIISKKCHIEEPKHDGGFGMEKREEKDFLYFYNLPSYDI